MHRPIKTRSWRTAACAAGAACCFAAVAAAAPSVPAAPPSTSPSTPPTATLEREGVRLKLWLQAVGPATGSSTPAALVRGQRARLRVEVRSSAGDTLLEGIDPGAWLDRLEGDAPGDAACSRRIGGFVNNMLTEQAWRDLTGYHVLLLNGGEGGISVLDPKTNFAGKTSLRTTLPLPGAGFDWDLHPRHDRLYVSVPQTQQLAVVDLATLAHPQLLTLPGSPGRVRVHPSGEQVWVGVPQPRVPRTNTGVQPAEGGVAVVSVRDPQRQAWVPTGNGHHEIAFDPDGLVAVTNRDSASLAFVDPRSASVRRRVPLDGGVPIAVVFHPRDRSFVVADARHGRLHRFDNDGSPLGAAIELAPGLGPMALSPDGRWLLALNPSGGKLHVVDMLRFAPLRDIAIAGRPFQLAFTSQYAYVRALDREDVAMIHWPSLGDGEPRLQRFVAGEKPPAAVADLPLASQLGVMPDDSGVFALSPADATVYTYMQGMNAPMSSASPRGYPLRAVMVARQGLLEVERGVFEAELTLPAAPRALLALATERPRTRHCVAVALAEPAGAALAGPPLRMRWQIDTDASQAPPQVQAEFEGRPAAWPEAITLWLFRPGEARQAVQARRALPAGTPDAAGSQRMVYAAQLPALRPGPYYVHLQPVADGIVSPALARQYGSFVVGADKENQR